MSIKIEDSKSYFCFLLIKKYKEKDKQIIKSNKKKTFTKLWYLRESGVLQTQWRNCKAIKIIALHEQLTLTNRNSKKRPSIFIRIVKILFFPKKFYFFFRKNSILIRVKNGKFKGSKKIRKRHAVLGPPFKTKIKKCPIYQWS